MDVYLLLIKDDLRGEFYHQTFEYKSDVLNAILVHLQDPDKSVKKIIKVSTITGNTDFYDLVMVNGKLKLKEVKQK